MSFVRSVALLLTVLTGFSGLVYEVTWQKYLATLVGSHAEATAAVLGIFLAGLSIGYGLFGHYTERRTALALTTGAPPRLLGHYGAIEIAIGLYAFAFPSLFRGIESLSIAMPIEHVGLRFAVDIVLTIVLIGPSAVMMGATVPFLTQALPTGIADASRLHAQIYALNTVGGCFGALAAAFWLVPAFGLIDVMYGVGTLNLLSGLGFLLLERGTDSFPAQSRSSRTSSETPRDRIGENRSELLPLTLAALLSGFAMMALQTAMIRLGGLSFGSSPVAFASVVSVFVLCIALGSLTVGLVPQIHPRALVVSQGLLVLFLLLLYWPLSQAPYWAYRLRALFSSEPAEFIPYWLSTVGLTALVLGPAIGLSGAMLPLLFDRLRDDPDRLGEISGRLYRWNTVGSLLGALLGGYWLLHWMDLDGVVRVAILALIVMTGLLVRATGAGPALRPLIALGLCFVLVVAALPAWDHDLLSMGLFRKREIGAGPAPSARALVESVFRNRETIFYDDDPVQSVAVRERERDGQRSLSLVNNGKSEGSTARDQVTMRFLALLPALLAERVERAFVIGLGTGMTAGELARLESVERVVASEISPAVIEALPLFDFATDDASTNQKIQVFEGDAYRQLSRDPDRYDMIVSEPSNPWVAGVEMLYSDAFLRAARARLRPGGVYVQWFHQYETSDETIEVILRTFTGVFADTAVWYSQEYDLLLVGFVDPVEGPGPLLDRATERMAQPMMASALARIGIDDVPSLLAHEIVPTGVLEETLPAGPIHRLYHPILSDVAGRGFFLGKEAGLPYAGVGRGRALGLERSLVKELARRNPTGEGRLSEPGRRAVVDEACRHNRWQCATWLAEWQAKSPQSPELLRWTEAREKESAEGRVVYRSYRPALAGALVPLFDPDRPRRGSITRPEALRIMALARLTYQPAMPFERAALEGIWDACPACAPVRSKLDVFLESGEVPVRLKPLR